MIAKPKDIDAVSELTYAERQRRHKAQVSREKYAKASDIGDIPPVKNPKRRAACRYDLHLFEQAYFPHSTGLSPFGAAQTNVLARIQDAILGAGRVLNCEPRGFAKSTKSENAILWAMLYGHRRYGLILGASSEHAADAISSIKRELQENDLLYEDFPEVVHAIRALEGRPQRCTSQTHKGKLTYIGWNADSIVFPKIDGSEASSAIIESKGYLSASRGIRFKRPDGTQARPDLVIIDDPQTDESAISPAQVTKRLNILKKAILRLGGHGKKVVAVMNATVIADGDMVDQLADHKLHPEWQAVRVKMLEQMPESIDEHWLGQYKRIRDDYDPDVIGDQARAHDKATEYYLANRDVMDAGAVVSWHHIPLEDGEVSPIQHAMNIFCDDGEDVFASECQNEPRRAIPAGVSNIDRNEVRQRLSGFARGVVPSGTAAVVAHCDIHDAILYWSVAAVKDDFTGSVIDYGTFPKQPTEHFSMYSIKRRLQDVVGTDSIEEAIVEGVKIVANQIGGKVWATPEGEALNVAAMLFDVGYKPEEVAKGIRLSDFANVCWGSRGRGIGPTDKPMTEYDTKRMRRAGPNPTRPRWYVPKESINGLASVHFDANFWKSAAAARFMQQQSTPGEWSLFGNHREDHSHYADHLTAEEPIPTTAKGKTVIVWKTRPNRENHWWDTCVGCNVAASLVGLVLPGGAQMRQAVKQRPRTKRRVAPLAC